MNISGELAKLLNSNENKGTKPYDTKAIVKRVENGVAWVHIPGGVDETPAQLTINAKPGDSVQVRVADGKAFLVGNGSAPPTDDTTARQAIDFSKIASDAANAAVQDAGKARTAADSAQAAADHAEEVAEGVEAIAESAKTAADTAFTNLSQVQSVLEVAQWIATHGTYVKATVFNPNATYYTITATQVAEPSDDDKDSQGVLIYYELDNGIYVRTTDTSVQSGKTYYRVTGTPVAQPSAEHIADYYTLAVSEAMADYVQSHLVLTDEGLWIIKDGSGYKLKLTDYGSYIVAPDGTTVVNQNTADGNIIRALNGTVIAHLGYGEGAAESGTADTPYYTFGRRNVATAVYDSTRRYSVGDLVIYNEQVYVCINDIQTPEQWTDSNWQLDIGNYSVAEGFLAISSGHSSHAEGARTKAIGSGSHAEGGGTVAKGTYSHAEGSGTTATGTYSHAEGSGTTATGTYSHAEGFLAISSGHSSHAEGRNATASGDNSHAEGERTTASGLRSHAQNYYTTAARRSQTTIGEFNKIDTYGADATERGKYAFIMGNGTPGNRSNGFTVDWDGRVECGSYQGKITSLLDLAHPKGSTYGTVLPPTINGHSYDDGNLTDADKDACGDTWFDPRIMWGGTWERLPEGYVMLSGSDGSAAGDTYVVGTDTSTDSGYKEYGENEHVLTTDEMPAHTHGNKSLTGGFHVRHYSGNNQLVFTPSGIVNVTKQSGTIAQLNIGGTGSNGGWEDVSINASHEHNSVGGGQATKLMQKSIAVYTWIRTA